jgi:hypothetical protein
VLDHRTLVQEHNPFLNSYFAGVKTEAWRGRAVSSGPWRAQRKLSATSPGNYWTSETVEGSPGGVHASTPPPSRASGPLAL